MYQFNVKTGNGFTTEDGMMFKSYDTAVIHAKHLLRERIELVLQTDLAESMETPLKDCFDLVCDTVLDGVLGEWVPEQATQQEESNDGATEEQG